MPFTSETGRLAGRKGGEATKHKLGNDPEQIKEYYSRIGTKGGKKLLQQRGPDYYSRLGSAGTKDAARRRAQEGEVAS